MKIIEVITDTNVGGAGVLLINRLKHTDLLMYDTEVILPRKSAIVPRLEGINVKFTEIDCNADKSFDLSSVRSYVKLFNEKKPDIVNCHGALSARIAAKICGVPIKICTRHCAFDVSLKERMSGRINNTLSDAFIAVAYAAKENLLSMGISEKKIHVIINGSCPLSTLSFEEKKALRQKLGINEETKVLVLCARLEPCKGHAWFFRSVQLLMEKGVDVKVLLLGTGTIENELKLLCEEYGISDKVIFLGFVADVAPFMNIADVNINCSVGTETSSLALSEGMSIGLPAVVSDYGGNPYMIEHGVNGYVCKCRDSKGLAEHIELTVKDENKYKELSEGAKRRFENELNAKMMTQKTNKLYDDLYNRCVAEQRSKS